MAETTSKRTSTRTTRTTSATASGDTPDEAGELAAEEQIAEADAAAQQDEVDAGGEAVAADEAPEPAESDPEDEAADDEDDADVVSVVVELPPQAPREAPDDEAAVAISDVAVDPVRVEATPTTRSITVITATAPAAPVAAAPAPAPDVVVATPTVAAAPEAAVPVTTGPNAYQASRRERMQGVVSDQPEPATMLTADRILDVRYRPTAQPTGWWRKAVFYATFRSVNLGDSPKERHRKELDYRIRRAFEGETRFVPVLTRKGGVGKTTVTTLLGMALASARDDRIIAIDANPDRGTLSERVPRHSHLTVRDVVHKAPQITSYTDFTAFVSRDETRLDVIASDTDPNLSEAFDENDYNVVADLVSRYYSIALTDCGTGIVHSVMRATLTRADSIVIVSGGSVDEARLASETLTWLESNGYGDLVRNAVVAINTATQGTNLVKLEEIESHFKTRVRAIVRIPYDPLLAAGSVVSYDNLKPITLEAARQLAALVVEGLPASREA